MTIELENILLFPLPFALANGQRKNKTNKGFSPINTAKKLLKFKKGE